MLRDLYRKLYLEIKYRWLVWTGQLELERKEEALWTDDYIPM